MILACALAAAAEPPLRAPISEVDHPRYVDATGTLVDWSEVRSLAANTDALARVRGRRLGRNALRVTFAAVTGVEVWGTLELAREQNYLALPLGAQAAFTGLCEVLLWTGIPGYRTQDRAIVLEGANGWVRTSGRP